MFSREPVDRSAGRWIYTVPRLGKHTLAFKVGVSQQMRDAIGLAKQPIYKQLAKGEFKVKADVDGGQRRCD